MSSRLIKIYVLLICLIGLINPAYAANFEAVSEGARAIAESYYENGKEVALKYPELFNYSDHGIHHAELVAIKSQAAADAINQAIAANPNHTLYAEIDKVELQVAAFMHDTGMDGGTFKEYKDGNALRKDHSLNSAIHVLENREKIAQLDVDVDSVALDCMAHSKSCSGVRDLTSFEEWIKCFNRIDEAVAMYNEKYPNNKIYFDRRKWVDGCEVYSEAFAHTASLVAALRKGYANREAAQYPFTQSGLFIDVNYDSFATNVDTWQEEVKNADVLFIGDNDEITVLSEAGVDTNGYGRMYSTGEGNLSMDCVYNFKSKAIQEQFKVLHSMSFPLSTQRCIEERLEELDTMKHFPVEAEIQIVDDNLSKIEKRKIKKIYQSYCKSAQNQHGYKVKLIFK